MNNTNDNNKDADDDEDSNDDNNDNDDDNDDDDDGDDDGDAMTMYIFIKTKNVIDHEHGGNVTGHANCVISCVPDKGRGSLAKISLLPHAVLSNYVMLSVNVVYDYYIDSIIERILDEKRVDFFPHKDGIKSLIDDDDDSVDQSTGSSFIIDYMVAYSIVLSSMISFFREYESYWFQRRCKPYRPSRRKNDYRRIVVPFCCKMLLDLTSATNYEVDMPTTLYSSLIFSIQRKHNR